MRKVLSGEKLCTEGCVGRESVYTPNRWKAKKLIPVHTLADMAQTKHLRTEFLDGCPEGLRRVTDYNWQGECLICSRAKLDRATDWELFDVPGVYVLVGPSEGQEHDGSVHCQPRVYIGQGDSVQDRLQAHIRDKDFWTTAVVFKRKDCLNAGNIKYLESRLCDLASKSGLCLLTNTVAPGMPSLPAAEKAETEDFLERILFFLAGLGWDFFRSPGAVANGTEARAAEPLPPSPPEVPQNVRTIFEKLKRVLSDLPGAEFYFTLSPDYRAKVTRGSEFRVFARLKLARRWIRVELKDVGSFKVIGAEGVRDEVLKAIDEAHSAAEKYLKQTKVTTVVQST
jgi:hypothetical protein